jgi:hypothetical protein
VLAGRAPSAASAPSATAAGDARWLDRSVAFVWLATGVLVLHPYYRAVGGAWLARLRLGPWAMWATCGAEVALGLRLCFGPPRAWLVAVQLGAVGAFTLVLAVLEPTLLADPFGALTKNVPLAAVVGTAWVVAREGWTARARRLLRAGMAVVWITEGLVPKILFQQPHELEVVAGSGLVPMDPALFLRLLGAAQVGSGVAALLLPRGRLLRALWGCQLAALAVLPVLVSLHDPLLWVHPFGPLIKNVPILAGTLALVRRC